MSTKTQDLLDDLKFIEEKDPNGMLETLAGLPEQCATALRLGMEAPLPVIPGQLKSIVLAGLGGSAIGGDLVRVTVANESPVPVNVYRDYVLPAYVGEGSLVFLTSYSGNTEETLSAYAEAGQKGASRVVVTTGGKLADLARSDGVPVVLVPAGLPPRSAVGYLFLPVYLMLGRLGVVKVADQDAKELVEVLGRWRGELAPQKPCSENRAKALAAELFGKIPVIYGAAHTTEVLATRWKGQFNENAKTLAYWNVFPELNHNEIVGFEAPPGLLKQLVCIILRDIDDHPRVQTRMEVTRGLLENRIASVHELYGEGNSRLARCFSLIYLGDYTSVYLAMLNGINPKPVPVIDFLKNKLAQS